MHPPPQHLLFHPQCIFEPVSLSQALTANGSLPAVSSLGGASTTASSLINEERFYELIGSQISAMQSKIEERLSKVEPLRQDCFDKLFRIAK